MEEAHACRRGAAGEIDRFRPAAVAALFAVLMAAAAIPIITHPLPPLADYLNHLSRTHIIDAIDSDPYFSRFYIVDWQIVPNLMIDLVIPALLRFTDIYLAGQIFTLLAFAFIVSGTLALNRALIGRWSALPLIAVPLLYNGVLLVGVMNYIFGIGIALWALAAWVFLRERSWPLRLAVSTVFAVALFFCHLYTVGLYGCGLLATELHRMWTKRAQWSVRSAGEFVSAGLPFIPVLALLLASPTWNVDGAPAYWEAGGKLEGLFLAINVYYPVVAWTLLAAAAVAAGAAYRRGALSFHPVGWAILGLGIVTYIAMPRALFGAYLADQRLPIALAFMLIACFDVRLRRAGQRILVTLLVLLVAVRVVEVQLVWDRLARGSDEFRQSVNAITRGARVLVVFGDRSSCKEISDFNLVHAASLATIERSALVSTEFTVRGKQILHPRKEFERLVETRDWLPPELPFVMQAADPADGATAGYFWNRWPQHYDYVYILFAKPNVANPNRKYLDRIFTGADFQLYRVHYPRVSTGP